MCKTKGCTWSSSIKKKLETPLAVLYYLHTTCNFHFKYLSIRHFFIGWLMFRKLTDLNCSCWGLIKIRPPLLVVRSLFEFQDVNCIQVQKLILDLTKHLKWTFLLEQLLILLAISEKVLSEMFEGVLNIPLIFSNAGN